jgi:hypothetical protein
MFTQNSFKVIGEASVPEADRMPSSVLYHTCCGALCNALTDNRQLSLHNKLLNSWMAHCKKLPKQDTTIDQRLVSTPLKDIVFAHVTYPDLFDCNGVGQEGCEPQVHFAAVVEGSGRNGNEREQLCFQELQLVEGGLPVIGEDASGLIGVQLGHARRCLTYQSQKPPDPFSRPLKKCCLFLSGLPEGVFCRALALRYCESQRLLP